MNLKTLLLTALAVSLSATIKAQVHELARPKLVVGLVIDQMRWDYLYRYMPHYGEGGFKRLLSEGYSCENTRIPYVPSVTAIGHSCIYTGSVPSIHGIAGNNSRCQHASVLYDRHCSHHCCQVAHSSPQWLHWPTHSTPIELIQY